MADEIYALTERGKAELQGGATSCAPHELEVLVLVDGAAPASALAARARSVPGAEVPAVLRRLVQLGLIEKAGAGAGPGYSYIGGAGLLTPAAKEADAGAADLQRKGYYVSIARRAAGACQPAQGVPPGVLIVEDDPVLAKMLGHLMTLEGFAPRIACRGAEIEAELGRQPPPAVVLLDVMLPDADGFDILERLKRDPAWRGIPVILVTGCTTREGVMRGLAGGADGYITKPIQYEALANGVKSVLGLGGAAAPAAATGDALGADDTVSELRRQYRRGLALKLARMEQLARELVPGLPERASYEELRRMAHSMAGTAPTFGLPEVGKAALALEQALEALGGGMHGDVATAKARVAALRTTINVAGREPAAPDG